MVAPEKKKSPVAAIFTIDASNPMSALLERIPTPPSSGDLVEGTIVALSRGRLYVDLPPFGTGLIYGREYLNAADNEIYHKGLHLYGADLARAFATRAGRKQARQVPMA